MNDLTPERLREMAGDWRRNYDLDPPLGPTELLSLANTLEGQQRAIEYLDGTFQHVFPDWSTVTPPMGVPLRVFLIERLHADLVEMTDRFEIEYEARQYMDKVAEERAELLAQQSKRIAELEAHLQAALSAGTVFAEKNASLREQIATLTKERDEALERLATEKHYHLDALDHIRKSGDSLYSEQVITAALRSENERLENERDFQTESVAKWQKAFGSLREENEQLKGELAARLRNRMEGPQFSQFLADCKTIADLRNELSREHEAHSSTMKAMETHIALEKAYLADLTRERERADRMASYDRQLQEVNQICHQERQRAAGIVESGVRSGYLRQFRNIDELREDLKAAILDGQSPAGEHEHKPDSYGYCPDCKPAPGEEGEKP